MPAYLKRSRFWFLLVLYWLVLSMMITFVAMVAGAERLSGARAAALVIVTQGGAVCLAWPIARRHVSSDAR